VHLLVLQPSTFLGGQFTGRSFGAQVSLQKFLQRHRATPAAA